MSNLELYAAVKAEEMKEGIVRKLLIKTKHSLEEIADLASISLSDVKLIKSRLATS